MTTREYRIWDPVIRLFHWLVASLFLLNYFVFEAGEDNHNMAGYIIAGAIAVRAVWGFIGTTHARFSQFFPTPARLARFIKNPSSRHQPQDGHNVLGSVMVIFMLLLLVTVCVSGYLQTTDAFWGEEWPQVLHEWAANLMLAAVGVHVVAVVVIQKMTQIPLIKPMITGIRKM